MLKDFMDYAKYVDFMNAYEDELYALCTEYPEKWQKIKASLNNKQYDVESDERIFLAGMKTTEFYVKICEDEDYIASHPLLSELNKITDEYEDEEEEE